MKAGPLAENRFSAGYLGRDFTFQKQSAAMRLAHQGRAREMVPRLCRLGLDEGQAYALAYNCVLLFQTLRGQDAVPSPEGVLDRFTLCQIADLCRLYWEHSDQAFDRARPPADAVWYDECAVNDSWDAQTGGTE